MNAKLGNSQNLWPKYLKERLKGRNCLFWLKVLEISIMAGWLHVYGKAG